jgi:uncharacterized LabA/DUF88 family protein
MPTAVLFDGDFFLRRYRYLKGSATPKQVANDLHRMAREHLRQEKRQPSDLYRIFFYDCPPLTHKVHNPVSQRAIDFSKTPTAVWRMALHEELRKLRKVALRLGYLNHRTGNWRLKSEVLKKLLSGAMRVAEIAEGDVFYEATQKGVDMRVGLDIASMAFKRQVDQVVLVAGDSDFVPAAKLARREGIDFILDPMWAKIGDDLHEHIDGLRSVFERPGASKAPSQPNVASSLQPSEENDSTQETV